jgi:hypothetical protein
VVLLRKSPPLELWYGSQKALLIKDDRHYKVLIRLIDRLLSYLNTTQMRFLNIQPCLAHLLTDDAAQIILLLF